MPKRLWLIAGPNGSGKSTLANRVIGDLRFSLENLINPDQYAREYQRSTPGIPEGARDLAAVLRAELEVWRCVAEQRSVAIETVLSTLKYQPVVLAARANGFEVGVIYISVPTVGYSIERIRTRVSAGGHDVPEDRIRARWPRSHDNLIVFATIVDQVFVFSNAGVEPVLVAEKTSRGESLNLLRPDELPEITYRLLRREG